MYPYQSKNGCSVRIGRGYDHTEVLLPEQCEIFEFVETFLEVQNMIKIIKRLPDYYRKKDESIDKLKTYADRHTVH